MSTRLARLAIVALMVVLGACTSEKVVTVPGPTQTVTITPSPRSAGTQSAHADLVRDFVRASFRVVAVVPNPNELNTLIVANRRAERGCGDGNDRCDNDTTCGSDYSVRPCYFFLEPQYHAEADPETVFIVTWQSPDQIDALVADSITFRSATRVRFRSEGGDGGVSVTSVWEIDLERKKVRRVSRDADGF